MAKEVDLKVQKLTCFSFIVLAFIAVSCLLPSIPLFLPGGFPLASFQRIELKVSVNCCDGCKIKVKKALRSVEGVLKTEIDPAKPKLTVIGNFDPQALIKKLLKVGKQAEILTQGNQSAGKETKETQTAASKEISKCGCENTKCPTTCSNKTEESKEAIKWENEGGIKASNRDHKEANTVTKASNSEVLKNENHHSPNPEANYTLYPSMSANPGNDRTYTQYCYKVEPCAITVPYYAIPSYSFPAPPPIYYAQDQYDRPVLQPPFQAPVDRVADYFNEDNTVGCNIM